MHVHVNAAISVDGKLSTRERCQVEISGPRDFDRVDRLRGSVDAVLVGVGTVLADDPSLTIPEALAADGQPARIVFDTAGRTPSDARVLSEEANSFVVVGRDASPTAIGRLEDAGATVIRTAGDGRVAVNEAIGRLEAAGIDRLLVEGGGEVLFSLFEAAIVDVVTVYVSPSIIGGRDAPTLVDGEGFDDVFPALRLDDVDRVDGGVLCTYEVVGWLDSPAG